MVYVDLEQLRAKGSSFWWNVFTSDDKFLGYVRTTENTAVAAIKVAAKEYKRPQASIRVEANFN